MLIETLKTDRRVHNEPLAEKVKSGGGVMASPRYREKAPKELKPQEGIER